VTNDNGDWRGKTGHISSEMIVTRVGRLAGPIYYIAGPPTMVAATRGTLSEVGVDEDDIRTEEFAGYENQASLAEPMISGDLSFR
jgi:NAD(P)H-flavin reductase